MPANETRKSQAETISDAITNAVMEHRIAPGSKLSESRMAEAFNVSRTKVRQALSILAENGLVRQSPNRGSFITSPSIQEAQEVFALRKVLEPEIIRNLLSNKKRIDLKALQAHVDAEDEARNKANRRLIIRLSGDFHMLLASMCGNRFIEKIMAELCPLTCLIIALYDVPQTPACPTGEHQMIVNAIKQGDESLAINLMLDHLNHIEGALNLDAGPDDDQIDWDFVLG